jgi:hypothetical protein
MKKYNIKEGKDELIKALLLMKYDTKKTLSENIDSIGTIKEQASYGATALGTGVGATTAVGVGAVGAGFGANVIPGAAALGTALSIPAAAGAAIIGGAAALALVPLAMWYIDKDNAKGKVEKMLNYCTSHAAQISKVPNGLSPQEIDDLSDRLFDALDGAGTNEDEVAAVFSSLKTVSDICSLNNSFNSDNTEDLLEWLDSDIDATDEWNSIYRPMRNIIKAWLLTIKEHDPVQKCPQGQFYNPETDKCQEGNCGGCIPSPCPTGTKFVNGKCVGTGGGSWKDCKGTYTRGCKSDAIAKVQGCLGLTTDGKFGPKTDAALKSKGFTNGFTDEDVTKICSRKDENTTTTTTYPFDSTYAETNDIK